MSARWVSEELTEFQLEKRLDICKRLLDRYGVEGDHFLERIFTGYETWIHHYETESKHQSMEWKRPYSHPFLLPHKKKISKPIRPQESCAYSFWDSQVLLMEHYQKTGTTVNSAHYSVTC